MANRRWLCGLVAVAMAVGVANPADADALDRTPPARGETQLDVAGTSQTVQARSRLGLDLVHRSGVDGTGRRIAVVSDGIDSTNPALAGSLAADEAACFDVLGATCPDDGDGDPGRSFGVGVAEPCGWSDCWRGTYLASIAGGGGGGGVPQGVAPAAEIIPIRVAQVTEANLVAALDHVASRDQVEAIDAVVVPVTDSGASASDCDWRDPDLADVIADLKAAGVAVVVMTGFGSDGTIGMPSCMSGATPVLASGAADTFSFFSKNDGTVELAAPTEEITGAVPGGAGTRTGHAHPAFVAGAVALLRDQDPDLTVDEIEHLLWDTGAHLNEPPLAIRRIDVAAALGLRSPQAQGLWVVTARGAVHARGEAPDLGGAPPLPSGETVVAGAPTASGGGYWLTTNRGRVIARGDALHRGDMVGTTLNGEIVAMATTVTGNGYWLLGRDGGVFSFGDARFHGSTGGMTLNAPVTDLATTPTGGGYWLTAMDGGVFSFGDARFYGSTGGMTLNQPVVSIAAQPSRGYWLVALDGGVFTFGGPLFHGSVPGTPFAGETGVRVRASADGRGYHILATTGRLHRFGAASAFSQVHVGDGDAVVDLLVPPPG